MRLIITSDWELTRERLPIAEIVLKELFSYVRPEDQFIFCGDMFREFNAATVTFAKKILGIHTFNEGSIFLVGNHDREIGADRLSALLSTAIKSPMVIGNLAFLPAPDRAAFGASRGPEGKRARDETLSNALEAALISLETQIGPENLGRAILFAHGATDGEEFGLGQLASGLTWTIPGVRLQRWGRVFLGHCHNPRQIAENVWSVGGICNWTFSDRAEQFRALVVDTETLEVSSIPLLRVLVPIEMELNERSAETGTLEDLPKWIMIRLGNRGVDLRTDTVSLKIKARLPQHEMALVPKAEDLQDAINNLVERKLIQSCIITREVTGLHKARLTTDRSKRLNLEEMLTLYARSLNDETPGSVTDELLDLAKDRLSRIADSYKQPPAMLGWRPVSLEVHNWRQWKHARIDYAGLHGAIAVTGPNRAGKSNLFIEALLFALCKREASGEITLDRIIRKGASSADNVLHFELGEDLYKLSRALERGRGKTSCKSELHKQVVGIEDGELDPFQWEPVSDDDKEIARWITEHIGSMEFIRWLIIRSQRDLARLIEANTADWHRILLTTFNLSGYEPLRKYADENAKNAALRQTEAGIRIEEIEKQLAESRKDFDAIDHDDLVCRIAGLAKQIADAEASKKSLDAERSALIERRAAIREAANTRANLETSIREAKRAFEKIVGEDIGRRPETPALDIDTLERLATELKARREELLEADTAKCKEINRATAEVENCEYKLKGIETEIAALEAQVKAFEEGRGKLEDPPCLTVLGPALSIRGECPAWLYYSKADRGKELLEKRAGAVERWNKEEQDRMLAYNLRASLKTEAVPITAELSAIVPTLRELETQIGDYRNVLHATELWDEKAKGRARACEQAAARAAELDDLQTKHAALADNGAEISETLLAIERTEDKIGVQDGIINAARQAAGEAEAEVAKRKSIAERIEKLSASIEQHRRDSEKHAADQRAWGLVARTFHATGAPYLILEMNVGRVQDVANELLAASGSDLRAIIRTISPTQKGEARDAIYIGFSDERGEFQISEASGEQSAVLSLALSPALSIAGAEYCGAVPEIYTQDEGWEWVGVDHQAEVRALIAEISRRFERFIYISHVEWPLEASDMQLRVEAEGGVSRLVG